MRDWSLRMSRWYGWKVVVNGKSKRCHTNSISWNKSSLCFRCIKTLIEVIINVLFVKRLKLLFLPNSEQWIRIKVRLIGGCKIIRAGYTPVWQNLWDHSIPWGYKSPIIAREYLVIFIQNPTVTLEKPNTRRTDTR